MYDNTLKSTALFPKKFPKRKLPSTGVKVENQPLVRVKDEAHIGATSTETSSTTPKGEAVKPAEKALGEPTATGTSLAEMLAETETPLGSGGVSLGANGLLTMDTPKTLVAGLGPRGGLVDTEDVPKLGLLGGDPNPEENVILTGMKNAAGTPFRLLNTFAGLVGESIVNSDSFKKGEAVGERLGEKLT